MAKVCGACGKQIGWNDAVMKRDGIPYHYRCRPSSSPVAPELVPCRVCGKQISSDAPSCPECGAPNPGGSAGTQGPVVAGESQKTGAGTVAAGVFSGIAGCVIVPLIILFFLLLALLFG